MLWSHYQDFKAPQVILSIAKVENPYSEDDCGQLPELFLWEKTLILDSENS